MSESQSREETRIKRSEETSWIGAAMLTLAGLGGYVTAPSPPFEAISLVGFVVGLLGLTIIELEVRDV